MSPQDKATYIAHGIDPDRGPTERIWTMGWMYGTRLSEAQFAEIKEWMRRQYLEGNTRAVRHMRAKAERTMLDILAKELASREHAQSAAE